MCYRQTPLNLQTQQIPFPVQTDTVSYNLVNLIMTVTVYSNLFTLTWIGHRLIIQCELA